MRKLWVVVAVVGALALAELLGEAKPARAEGLTDPLAPRQPHYPAKAKRVIYLFQSGGPSQMELFDPKPMLEPHRGEDLPASVRGGQRLTGMTAGQARFPIAPSHWAFKQYGKSGTWISDLLP